MTCPYCQTSGRPTSRIPVDLQEKCHKNRIGTCRACSKLSDIERKITEARRVLKLLLDEKEALASILNEHHDPITQHLPPEIVSQIFVYVKPPTPPSDKELYDEQELIAAVSTSGQICKDWRHIARSTPQLWTVLCTTITQSNCIPSIAMVHDWFELSGGLSLFLQISVTSAPNKLVAQTTREIMALAIVHAQRWEVLNLKVPYNLLPWMSEALMNNNLDRLQIINRRSHSAWDDEDVLSLSAAPHQVSQECGFFHQISIHRQHITHIVLYIFHVQDAQELFREAQQLSSCVCGSFTTGEIEETSSESPTFAPSLRIFSAEAAMAEVWDYLQFPSLENLVVRWPTHKDESGDQLWGNVSAILRRSSCSLRELRIHDSHHCHNAIMEVLKATPDLERLFIDGDILCSPLFSLLHAATTLTGPKEPLPNFLGNSDL